MARGQRTKLTPAVQTAICDAVAAGIPYVQAALHVGIRQSTALQWLQRGEGTHVRPARKVFVEFVEAVARAKAQDMARRVARINQAGQGGAVLFEKVIETVDKDGRVTKRVIAQRKAPPDWRADAWHLERAYAREFGDRRALIVHQQEEAEEHVTMLMEKYGLTRRQIQDEIEALTREIAAWRRTRLNGHHQGC
jgi:hypothetical protein